MYVFNQKASKPTTNSNVAVFPGCVWVSGEAPWSLASIRVPTVVIVESAIGVPAIKQTRLVRVREKSIKQ